jgi:non-canonical poly(A) RNA polymerase PAPD5/7
MASAPGTDRYLPRYETDRGPPEPPPVIQKTMYEFHGNQGEGLARPPRGGEFTFRQGPRQRISDRPLLKERRLSSPDPVFRSGDAKDKFRHVDDLTDSQEDEVDDLQLEQDSEQRPSKRLRSGSSWCNPDPYTALPPVPATPKKNKDVVKLIRRSRVTIPAQSTNAMAPNGEDFISFDMGDDVENRNNPPFNKPLFNEPPVNAPTGPKIHLSDYPTQPNKRKHDALGDMNKLPPQARKGARLHQQGRILNEWRASDSGSSAPWYRSPTSSDLLPGVA